MRSLLSRVTTADTAERCLGHALRGERKRYDHHSYEQNGLRGPGPAACDDHCSIAPGAYADLNTYEHYVADKKWPFWSLAPQVYLTFIRRLVVT